jgi:hypothetical protein
MRYLISYDLVAPGKDYQPLWDALAAIGAVRVLASQWVVSHSNATPKSIGDYCVKSMDANDRILVTELSDNYASRGLLATPKAA